MNKSSDFSFNTVQKLEVFVDIILIASLVAPVLKVPAIFKGKVVLLLDRLHIVWDSGLFLIPFAADLLPALLLDDAALEVVDWLHYLLLLEVWLH